MSGEYLINHTVSNINFKSKKIQRKYSNTVYVQFSRTMWYVTGERRMILTSGRLEFKSQKNHLLVRKSRKKYLTSLTSFFLS